jgi:hypothetical protein
MRRSRVRFVLFAVDAFVALTATGGGIALATGAEGDRFPVEWLQGTPFKSYQMPGIILAGAAGGSATAAAAATLRDPRSGGLASLLSGLILTGWIAAEIRLLKRPPSCGTLWEVFYGALGLIMTVLGLRVRRGETRRRSWLGGG